MTLAVTAQKSRCHTVTGQYRGDIMGIITEGDIKGDSLVEEAISLYAEMIKAQGDRMRFRRLESRANRAWAALSRDQQLVAVNQCVKLGIMSEKVSKILTMFNGKIDKI